eukprot:472550_1
MRPNSRIYEEFESLQIEMIKKIEYISQLQAQNAALQQKIVTGNETKEAQRTTILQLQNDVERFEQEEEEKSTVKEKMQFLANELTDFKTKYDKNCISNLYKEQMDQLLVQNEINHLETSLGSFANYLLAIKAHINTLMAPDVSNYKQWNMDEMMTWIASLQEGHFRKYTAILRQGFLNDQIDGELLPDITKNDLRDAPFNMENFRDRMDLVNHFQSLKTPPKQQSKQDSEGIMTEYH